MTPLDDARLLIDLVSTPSVSGNERAAAARFADAATRRGFNAEIDEAGSALASRGPTAAEPNIHIVLLGHIDTVPGDLPVRVENGVLHGRGSVDAKGPLAAMLAAATRAKLPPAVRLTVAAAAGEEAPDSPGATRLRDRYRPSACIIGEPSGWDGVTLGYKGRLLATATAHTDNAHSAGPEPSAADRVLTWWNAVRDAIAADDDAPRVFDVLQSTVESMTSSNDGLAQRAELRAGFRLPPGITPQALIDTLTSLADDEVLVRCTGATAAHLTDRNDPVVRALSAGVRAAGGRPRPKLKTGTADFNVVGPVWNCPIAAYGPGDSALDHTPRERLALDDYHRSIAVLTHAIESLAAELTDATPS